MPLELRLLLAYGISKTALGLALSAASLTSGAQTLTYVDVFAILFPLLCGGIGGGLIVAGRPRNGAPYLGALLLCSGTVFAGLAIRRSHWIDLDELRVLRLAMALRPDAFAPYFAWKFASAFPVLTTGSQHLGGARAGTRLALMVGSSLFVVDALSQFAPTSIGALRVLASSSARGAYWPILFVTGASALALIVRRTFKASFEQRARVATLGFGIALALSPQLGWTMAAVLAPSVANASPLLINGTAYAGLLMLPIVSAYAISVDRTLDLRQLARSAIKYALARYTLALLVVIPLVVALSLAYTERDVSIATLATSSRGFALLASVAVGATGFVMRPRLLRELDHHFRGDEVDVGRLWQKVTDAGREGRSIEDFTSQLVREIRRALHTERACVLVVTPGGTDLRPIASDHALLHPSPDLWALLEGGTLIQQDNESVSGLPPADAAWFSSEGFVAVMGICGAGGVPIGALALGARASGAEYSDRDHDVLRGLVATVAIVLQQSVDSRRPLGAAIEFRASRECRACGLVSATASPGYCAECGAATEMGLLPAVLNGRYQVRRRVGNGAMGVVYAGVDLELERAVALKTLTTPGESGGDDLRREARSLARVTHPGIASIFGTERWRDRSVLISEYLPGGTLADRISAGRCEAADVLRWAISLCDALAAIHSAGLLHADVKPANIAFTAEGRPKLLDFGLTRLLEAAHAEPVNRWAPSDGPDVPHYGSSSLRGGTPRYMSPEVLLGGRPEAVDDLWGLAVTLQEAVVVPRAMARGHEEGAGTLAQVHVEPGEGLWFVLAKATHPSRSERFTSAAAMRRALLDG